MTLDWLNEGVWAGVIAPACAGVSVRLANCAPGPAPRLGVVIMVLAAASAGVVMAGSARAGAPYQVIWLVSALIYLAAFDLRFMAVPVAPVFVLGAIGLGFAYFDGVIVEHALAALSGWAAFAAIDRFYQAIRGESGLGAGDALVAGLIGAWLSWEGLAWSVALGGVVGVIFAVARGAKRREPMPFVPALAAGAGFVLIGGVT